MADAPDSSQLEIDTATALVAAYNANIVQNASIMQALQSIMTSNQNWKILPQSNGTLNSQFPAGGNPPPPQPSIGVIANIPVGASPIVLNLAGYITGSYTSLAVLNRPSGWSFVGTTLTGTAPASAGTTLQLQVTWSGGVVLSNFFSVPALVASPTANTFAPTIPVAVQVAISGTNVAGTFNPSMACAPAGYVWNGMAVHPNFAYHVQRQVDGGAFSPLGSGYFGSVGIAFTGTGLDLGTVSIAGSTVQTGNSFAMSGEGSGYFNTADSGQIFYFPITGNFVMTGKFTSVVCAANAFAFVGFDARNAIDAVNGPGSPHVLATVRPYAGGVGANLNYRAIQGGTTAFTAGVANSTAGQYVMYSRSGAASNTWSMWMSLNPNALGTAAALIETVTQTMNAQVFIALVCASGQAGATATAQIDQFGVTQNLPINFIDSNPPGGHTYGYEVDAVDAVGNTSAYSPASSIAVSSGGGGTSLANYVNGLPAAKQYLTGMHWDLFTSNSDAGIWDLCCVLNGPATLTALGSNFPNISILNKTTGGTVSNSNLRPAILGGFIPTKATGKSFTGTSVTVPGALAACQAIQAAGNILLITFHPPSPVTDTLPGNGTEFPQCLQNGTAANTTLNSAIDNQTTQLLQLAQPFLIRLYHEANGARGGTYWDGTGGVNSTIHPTNADAVAIYQYTVNRMVANGLSQSKALFVYSTNLYGAGSSANPGHKENDPGVTFAPFAGTDAYGGGSTSAAIAATMTTYGCGYFETRGTPWLLTEFGTTSATQPATYSGDNTQYGIALQATFPHLIGSVNWPQNWALSLQYNGGTYLSQNVNFNGLPVFGTGGGSTPSSSAFYVSPSGNDSNAGTLAAPFKTLGKAQTAMQGSSVKTTYLRAGTYASTALSLTVSDNGETWSYYAPDGYNTAILDGGASSPTTGGNPITIDGASNVAINGLMIQNCKAWGIGLHGGPADPNAGFASTTATADSNAISNCIIHHVYTVGSWTGSGIWYSTNVTNLTLANNVVHDAQGTAMAGYTHYTYNGGDSPPDHTLGNFSGLTIENNVLYLVCQQTADCGAIYIQDQTTQTSTGSSPITIKNNFIRDYQGNNPTSPSNLGRAVAIYLDDGTSNVTATGNVIANTANQPTPGGVAGSTSAYWINNGRNNTFSGNLVDLGTLAYIADGAFSPTASPNPTFPMTGNVVSGNIFIGNWAGGQLAQVLGAGAGPGWFYTPTPASPIPSNNLYYNYGSGTLGTTANISGHNDTSPITGTNPQISGVTYTIAGASPVFSAPLNFAPIVGAWGPPGYLIPAGTLPCYG